MQRMIDGKLSDDAKRFRDEYNMHRAADPHNSVGKWIAVRLSDGGTDHILYDSKRDAVRHTKGNEHNHCFAQILPKTMGGHEAQTFLDMNRRLTNAGFKLADPDDVNGGKDIIKRSTKADQKSQIGSMLGFGKPSNISHGMENF